MGVRVARELMAAVDHRLDERGATPGARAQVEEGRLSALLREDVEDGLRVLARAVVEREGYVLLRPAGLGVLGADDEVLGLLDEALVHHLAGLLARPDALFAGTAPLLDVLDRPPASIWRPGAMGSAAST